MSAVVIAETLRRHFGFLGYVTTLLILIVLVTTMAATGAMQAPYEIIILFALITGCQLIGPEFASGTLQLILSKPVGRSAYLLSRVTGVVLSVWAVIAVVGCSDLAGRLIAGTPVAWRLMAAAAVASAMKVLFLCSLLAFLGSFTRSYANVGIYIAAQILLPMITVMLRMIRNATTGEMAGIGSFLRAHDGVFEALGAINANLFPGTPLIPFDRNWILMIVCNSAVVLLFACVIFSRREVPYGAD